MASGGKRAGAGKPKGSKHAKTLEKGELRRQFEQKVARRFDPLADALLSAGTGVHHLMAKDRDGTWTEVTDPRVMVKVLNSGEAFYRIYARNPDVRALKDIFDRLWGTPTQAVDLTVSGQVDVATVLRERFTRHHARDQS